MTKVFLYNKHLWTQELIGTNIASIVPATFAILGARRLELFREEQSRWDDLARFKASHPRNLAEGELAELRRLRAAWTVAAQALMRLDSLETRSFV